MICCHVCLRSRRKGRTQDPDADTKTVQCSLIDKQAEDFLGVKAGQDQNQHIRRCLDGPPKAKWQSCNKQKHTKKRYKTEHDTVEQTYRIKQEAEYSNRKTMTCICMDVVMFFCLLRFKTSLGGTWSPSLWSMMLKVWDWDTYGSLL